MTGDLDPAAMARTVPLRRPGNEEVGLLYDRLCEGIDVHWQSVQEMAGAILHLASRAGAYINGSVFLIDGGRFTGLAPPL
jgi:NAD(P)-dependent dehydrogenase (short-subunit alcohol dehydrogenase family)